VVGETGKATATPHLTAAGEDYLKEIFHLAAEGPVTTQALADRLGVAAPSVTNMVKRLGEMRLVVHSPYQGIELTSTGQAVATEIVRHHRLLELYLAEFLDVPWDEVHAEAERLEHVISEELESRISAKLGEPTHDPHGDPIPTRDGTVPWRAVRSLGELEAGGVGQVAQITLQEQPVLQYLASLGVRPGVPIVVQDVAPFGGVVTVLVQQDGTGVPQALGETLARHILVTDLDPSPGSSE
jgi:DtxR family Mn-dependent transcriptional regulator